MKSIPFFREQSLGCFFFLTFLILKAFLGHRLFGVSGRNELIHSGKEELPHEDLGCTCFFRLADQLKKP